VHAAILPSNRSLPNDETVESLSTGWTVQQPWSHNCCPVPIACVLCASPMDQREWRTHRCPVDALVGHLLWEEG
jgi:hypothetical protein